MAERDDLIDSLNRQRFFLSNTLRGLTDAQAAARPSASELCLGGLVKHVGRAEAQWADFIQRGASAMAAFADEAAMARWMGAFAMTDDDTVDSVIAGYDEIARRTNELVRSLPDLDAVQALPEAPWFEPGASWSARRVVLHVIAEIAQHAGHADIIRESLDGAKSMG